MRTCRGWACENPFDRLLIAQAKIEKLPVITPDRHFRPYGIDVIW